MTDVTPAPIATYFRVCDGVRIRFADTKTKSDVTMLMLAPWPETLLAFRRIWHTVASVGRVVAIEMPGFGHSDGREELISPEGAAIFLARLIKEWDLGEPLPNCEAHQLDAGHFAWEQASDEYGRLVAEWVGDGYRRVVPV